MEVEEGLVCLSMTTRLSIGIVGLMLFGLALMTTRLSIGIVGLLLFGFALVGYEKVTRTITFDPSYPGPQNLTIAFRLTPCSNDIGHWSVLQDIKMLIATGVHMERERSKIRERLTRTYILPVQYHEKKELERFYVEDGVEICNLSHMRTIGDRSYKTIQKFVDGEVQTEKVETTLATDEVAEFNEDWDKKLEIFDKLSGKRKKSPR